MSETWLRTNRRLSFVGAGLALAVSLACALLVLAARVWGASNVLLGLLGCLALGAGGVALVALWSAGRPRLAYTPGFLLVYLRGVTPFRLPIEVVECFLMGRGPSFLPGSQNSETETTTVVVRLRPQAEEWSHVDVEYRLGSWCDSHIIIRGTWCEPVNVDVVMQLNARLAAAQQAGAPSKRSS